MIPVVDRVPTYPGRVKITKENGGTVEYVTWERADEPTEEGTPLNAELFKSIQDDIGLSENVEIYVSASGSNTLGDGTVANPYATITKALSTIPTNLNGYTASINIAAGTYNEEVAVIDFCGGSIVFTGANGGSVTVTNMVISRAQVGINNIELTAGASGATAVSLSRHGMLVANTRLRIPRGVWGVQAQTGSVAILNSGVTVNNSTSGAILAGSSASIFVSDIAGSGNAVGISVNSGAVVAYGERTIASTVANTTSSGGRILSGSQTSIPNY